LLEHRLLTRPREQVKRPPPEGIGEELAEAVVHLATVEPDAGLAERLAESLGAEVDGQCTPLDLELVEAIVEDEFVGLSVTGKGKPILGQ
jgi:hypothetical protein